MFFFTLNISYARVCKLQRCVVTDLPFSKSSEKLDEKSYVKLSALLCNPLMQYLMFYCGSSKLKDRKLRNKIGIH